MLRDVFLIAKTPLLGEEGKNPRLYYLSNTPLRPGLHSHGPPACSFHTLFEQNVRHPRFGALYVAFVSIFRGLSKFYGLAV